MSVKGTVRVFGVAAIPLVFSAMLQAQTGDTAAIQAKLTSQFKVTQITSDRSDIVKAGDVVQLHKPGLLMYAVSSPLPPSNTYKNGKIGQGMSGFGKDILIGMLTPGGTTPAATYPQRQFVPEEKCWLTGFQVQKDGILFQLYSDPYDDIRYYANLKIPFPVKKEIPSVDAALRLVAEVLTVAPPDNQGAQPEQSVQPPPPDTGAAQASQQPAIPGEFSAAGGSRLDLLSDGSFTKFVAGGQGKGQYVTNGDTLTLTFTSTSFSQTLKIQGGILLDTNTNQIWTRTGDVPSAPMADIAPPPPPADNPPPTIALGQTRTQVTAAFGQPTRKVTVGVKEIYFYKDMKVTFVNGKVSNVE